jgi:hypothetical protein
MSEKGREKLVNSLLQDFSDAELLETLARDLRKRLGLPKDP